MMFNLYDFGYFEFVFGEYIIRDNRFMLLFQLNLLVVDLLVVDYQQWLLLLKFNFLWNCYRVQCFFFKIVKIILIEKKILNLMFVEKNEIFEEYIIKKKVRECKFNIYIKIICFI